MANLSSFRDLGFILVAGLSAACAADEALTSTVSGVPDAGTTRHAVLHATASSSRTTGVATPIQIQGQLIAWSGVEHQALFDALGLWTPRTDHEACRILEEPRVDSPGLEVRFEDMGPLWLSARGETLLSSARELPSMGSRMAGVMYTTEGPVFDEHDVPVRLYLGFPGLADSPVWPVSVPAPVRIAQVAGADPGTASRVPVSGSEEVSVDLASEAEVLEVLIRPASGVPWPIMECRVLSAESMILDPSEMERWFGDVDLELVVMSRQVIRSSMRDATPVDVIVEWRDQIVLERQ